jgi:hypothetical protein
MDSEPAPKRARADKVYSRVFWSSFDEVEMSDKLLNEKVDFTRSQANLLQRARTANLRLSNGIIDAAVAGSVDGDLQKLILDVVEQQNHLVTEMFEFMKEAADIFGYSRPLILDPNEVLNLAQSLQMSVSRKQLGAYSKETVRFYLTLDDPVDGPDLKTYVNLAQRMRGDKQAIAFINAISEGFGDKNKQGAFFALCVPSGTGKTQLAFTLPEDWHVVYMNMSLEQGVSPPAPAYLPKFLVIHAFHFRETQRGLCEQQY